MALPQIDMLYGLPFAEPVRIFFRTLQDGAVQPPTSTQIVVSADHGLRVVFKGTFTVVGGDVTAGTVTGFNAFAGTTKMEKGSGFSIDGAALFDALPNYDTDPQPFDHLFFGNELRIEGTKFDDSFSGGENDDQLVGKAGHDELYGAEGDDLLRGGKGSDKVDSSPGVDKFYGGKGADLFSFNIAPDPSIGLGKIKDFEVGKDMIGILPFGFELPKGLLQPQYFHKGTEATTAQQVIIYDKSTGRLFFDVDGVGVEAQFQFAKVGEGTKLNADDFMVESFFIF